MAVISSCAQLIGGLDGSCVAPARRFYQQAVLINKTDIESFTITLPTYGDTSECNYKVAFQLKEGATGYRFTGPEAGSTFFGSHDKTRSDIGHAQYKHNLQILGIGETEEAKCILAAIDKGLFVGALQLTDGTVIIYGMGNGLTTGDYTYNVQEGGGGVPIMLSSLDVAPENNLPLVYEAAVPGEENADFDALFAATV